MLRIELPVTYPPMKLSLRLARPNAGGSAINGFIYSNVRDCFKKPWNHLCSGLVNFTYRSAVRHKRAIIARPWTRTIERHVVHCCPGVNISLKVSVIMFWIVPKHIIGIQKKSWRPQIRWSSRCCQRMLRTMGNPKWTPVVQKWRIKDVSMHFWFRERKMESLAIMESAKINLV